MAGRKVGGSPAAGQSGIRGVRASKDLTVSGAEFTTHKDRDRARPFNPGAAAYEDQLGSKTGAPVDSHVEHMSKTTAAGSPGRQRSPFGPLTRGDE